MNFRELQALILATNGCDRYTKAKVLKILPDLEEHLEEPVTATNEDMVTVTLPKRVWRPILTAVIAYGYKCRAKAAKDPAPPGSKANMNELHYQSMAEASEAISDAVGSTQRLRLDQPHA